MPVACVALVHLAVAASLSAEVKLPSVLGSNMVLQRDMPVAIWGWADPGEQVTVRFAGQEKTAQTGDDGCWKVVFDKTDAAGPLDIVVDGSKSEPITLGNVLMGEVWICSGQSNMQWTVANADNAKEEIAAANHPQIRLFTVPRRPTETPQDNCEGKWDVCSPETIPNFSAVGYYFGRDLQGKLGVPVGLINTSFGGTPAEAWTSRTALEAESELEPLLKRWDDTVANYDQEKAEAAYKAAIARWQAAAKKVKAEGKQPPRHPGKLPNPALSQHRPANLYNGMLAPLLPLSVRGAIWYQGESNVSRAYQYRTLFPTMIANWRQVFRQPDLPFGFVQIAPFRYGGDPRACAELWEAQLLTLNNVPHTGMVVTTDIGNLTNIHPTNKQEVGRRMSLWALATVYGRDQVYSGPIYKSMHLEGSKVRLKFDHVDGGLTSSDGEPLVEFTIAGEDGQFQPATATIDGDSIVVASDKVAQPVAVRFAWRHDAEPNLGNKAGLPASPFRTDDLPGVTRDAK